MTDLEMLELLEKAKEKNTGPKGEPGVGIQSVEQFEDNSFTFRLTDGSFKKIQLPTPQDGAVGPEGVQGERGLQGPAGKSGRDGATGNPGVDGLRGSDGSFVETALVNARGRLLIGLSDGEVIDAGAVVGPVGATGERGATGLPGQPGADGAAVLSGPRTPTQEDGVEGDHWIDISSAEFSFYKKSGNGWSRLASLRQPAKDTRVGAGAGGGSGSGGGGGGDLQTTATLPLANPSAFKNHSLALPPSDGLKTQQQMNEWFYQALVDIEGGNAQIIVDDTAPENFEEGMLWFDNSSEVMELFIYVEGAWVSATPNSEDALESRIKANEDGIRDLNNDQQRQDFEIAGLGNRVDQLEGKVGEYLYTLNTSNPTPRDGQVVLLKGDLSTTIRWEDAEHIAFNPNSLSGEIFDVSEVVTGDVIRLFIQGDITMQVSAFEVKVVQNDTGILSISQTIKAVGTGMDGSLYEVEHLSSFDPSGLATMDYVDAQTDNKLGKTDANFVNNNFRIKSDSKTYISTSGNELALNNLREPTIDHHAASKGYVDAQLGVPVGCIMMWMNSAVPDGWFKLQGGNFDTSVYPKLHTYLLSTDGYVAGKLPDWKGLYPGEYGDHLAGVSLGKKLGQRTAMPNAGTPKSSNQIPDGGIRTFTATGNTNAYSDGIRQVEIDTNWDSVTRPPTVVVHYIIKGD